ncbi:O-antigen ligase family protein [Singulisphaera acidiphila]|uniref:Lipid A core-O-antigen ligase-like enyme n=1 Tax=Singulisphaera acidiphila (strain ATCC BAA-1392 / DSM 18658 / VKM B-2454 / MOB10) TaxID=886293 RepID=L0D8F6_SINAD|nr:O-antigen ligase family protein [Singulisphaera acidiphila]AGA25694.1 lipid A core-O-antigen ligase-like enyme [Singulisphaera acidiphila DSM 18658]
MARRSPRPTVLPNPRLDRKGPESLSDDSDAELAAWLGERLRRVALGLTVALLTARAYWPSEVDPKAEGGAGLYWDLAVLLVVGLAVAAGLVGGVVRLRWSWTDAAVIALITLVGLSAGQAYDRRLAINLAWDWGAVGLAYLLVRNLPRTRSESVVVAGALVATAVSVAVFGLYHAGVEMPQTRAYYLAHRLEVLKQMGYAPGSTAAKMFEDRLNSTETMSTFALANSLAGFLVGPLVLMVAVGWENLIRRDGRRSRLASLALAILPALAILVCLILTKSRSSYIGFAVGLLALAWCERRRASKKTLLLVALGGLVVIGGLVSAGLATGKLDRQVLTQSPMSLRYRREYWVGAWRVITERKEVFWGGRGPGNFTAPYLRHKLPEASEEIFDPHNLVLEVWSTAGALAMVALVTGLGVAFWNLLRTAPASVELPVEGASKPLSALEWPSDPPRRTNWLLVCAGGGWVLASVLGTLNPFEGDMPNRWLILGLAWVWAVLFGLQVWRRVPISAVGFGAGALAIAINLLAAGGIGIAGVALMLWSLIALGLNLREDRPCGRLREPGGRFLGFGLALAWAALLGTFIGAILPFWRSEAAIAEADAALRANPPKFEVAEAAYREAYSFDKYSARPWLGLAFEKYREWESRGAKPEDMRWKTIPASMVEAVSPPRNPNSWTLHHERAKVTRQLLNQLGDKLKPGELTTYRANIVEATRRASRLYPSNATLHAELALASAEIGMYGDAAKEAEEALRYDGLTPHADKKLAPLLRKQIEAELPGWKKSAISMPAGGKMPE